MSRISEFREQNRWLSNFAPVVVKLDGLWYPSVEHAYQAAKTVVASEREEIRTEVSPGKAKRLGRSVTMRPDWNDIKYSVMLDLVRQKFARGNWYSKKLLATGDAYIEEGNTWGDKYWGVDARTGVGENNLGCIIMIVRDSLQRNN